jgi:hypothetical protein
LDKNPAYPPAIQELIDEEVLPKVTLFRQTKYLNNIVEQIVILTACGTESPKAAPTTTSAPKQEAPPTSSAAPKAQEPAKVIPEPVIAPAPKQEVPAASSAVPKEKEPAKKIPEYKIGEKADISVGANKRYRYEVIVDADIQEEDVKKVASDIVEKTKKETPFNAVVIFFHADASSIGKGYTVGKVEYVPYGALASAQKVKTGDYSKHEYTYMIKKK